jgi:DNA-binding transcriptional LysR family regulator
MVELSEMLGIRGSELVLDSPLSVGLLRSPTFLNEGSFCIETILREPFVVAVSDSHPAAKEDSVRIKTLAGDPFIVPPRQPGWGYSDAIFQLLRDNDIEPRIAHEPRQMLTIASLVSGGLGVALVPASFSNLRLPGVTYGPIKGRSATTDLAMVRKRESRASTLRAFLNVCLELNIPRGERADHPQTASERKCALKR